MSTYSRHHAHFPIAVGLIVLGASCSGTEDKPPIKGDAGADSGAEHAGDGGTDAAEGSNEDSDDNSTGGGGSISLPVKARRSSLQRMCRNYAHLRFQNRAGTSVCVERWHRECSHRRYGGRERHRQSRGRH